MLTFKFLVLFLVYVLCDIVICGRISHSSEDGNRQDQQALSGENLNYVPSILTHRLNQIHNARKRSVFMAPLRHIVGHIAEHLGFHRAHTDFQERQFHPHHDSSFYQHHNLHQGHILRNDFPAHCGSHEYYGHRPRFPGIDYIPDSDEHGVNFMPDYPETNFHHHQIPNEENNHDHRLHDENPQQTYGISEAEHNHHQITKDENNHDHRFHDEKPHQTHGISEEEWNYHHIPNDEKNHDHRFHAEEPHQYHGTTQEKHNLHQIPKEENNHEHRTHDERPHQTYGISKKGLNHHQIPKDENNHDHRFHDEKPHPNHGITKENQNHHQIPKDENNQNHRTPGISEMEHNHHQILNDEKNHDHRSHGEKPHQTHVKTEEDRNHDQIPNDENNHDHISHDEKPHDEIPEDKRNDQPALEQTTKSIKPAIYPPIEENDQGSKNDDNDYPVNDFDKNKDGKSADGKPKQVNSGANIENDFPGSAGDGKDLGSTYPEWVHPQQDDVENMGGEIPPWSKIDIRFRKI